MNKKQREHAKQRRLLKKTKCEAERIKRTARRTREMDEMREYARHLYMWEYHTLSFVRLNAEMREKYGEVLPYSREWSTFWSLIPPGEYPGFKAQEYLLACANTLERALADGIRKESLAYWYHIYRRLGLGSVGENKDSATIYHVRTILDAAFQKYGQLAPSKRLVSSHETAASDIFLGASETELKYLNAMTANQPPQLVLHKFSFQDLHDFFRLERQAYEMWRVSALLRVTGKGAGVLVLEEAPYVVDTRNDELDYLVKNYDERDHGAISMGSWATYSGTTINTGGGNKAAAICFVLNVQEEPESLAKHLLAEELEIEEDVKSILQYSSVLLDFRAYYQAHRPLEVAFAERYKFSLGGSLSVLAAICHLPFMGRMLEPKPTMLSRTLQLFRAERRGYLGAYRIERVMHWIIGLLPHLQSRIGYLEEISTAEINSVVDWLTVTEESRKSIGLLYPGPHLVLLPAPPIDNAPIQFYLDYAWIIRRLRDLFVGVSISDNNFKGESLELAVAYSDMPITNKRVVGADGTSKQIDASFRVGTRLFIVECRAWSRSIGYECGQRIAVEQRNALMKKTLLDIDDKARWLQRNPVGPTHDVREFKELIPLGVSPFAEFVPSQMSWYWLREDLPRLLTPSELRAELESTDDTVGYYNTFPLEANRTL